MAIRTVKVRTSEQPQVKTPRQYVEEYALDWTIGSILALIAAIASFFGAMTIHPAVFTGGAGDVWFDSDMAQYIGAMLYRDANHTRSDKHPLFSLMIYPPVFVLEKLTNNPTLSVQLLVAFFALLFIGILFATLRLMGCRRWDALLFTAIGLTSAASMFWLAIPESFVLGAFTILLALGFAVYIPGRSVPQVWYVLMSAATLSVTVTNWMSGILVTAVGQTKKRAVQITAYALGIVIALWCVVKVVFPSARFPFWVSEREGAHILKFQYGGPLQAVKSFVCDTMVMPAIQLVSAPSSVQPESNLLYMTVQSSTPGSGSVWGAIAVGLWIALLAIGVFGLISTKKLPQLRIVLALSLLGQLILHIAYGNETFLFAPHFLALLLPLAALGTLTRLRQYVLLTAGLLLLTGGINNLLMFHKALDLVQSGALRIPGTF